MNHLPDYRSSLDPANTSAFESFFADVIEALPLLVWKANEKWLESDQACKIIRKAHKDELTAEQTAELIKSFRSGI